MSQEEEAAMEQEAQRGRAEESAAAQQRQTTCAGQGTPQATREADWLRRDARRSDPRNAPGH